MERIKNFKLFEHVDKMDERNKKITIQELRNLLL